ncbi:hypothetical protein EEL30_26005 [Brevibacillus laterosporus]|uniref:Uncharacterized protein n=1 Tax=Brevibacillus laterosporus TaxID=1465 RepID=A0A518VEJ8_BRELA|nr:hypothetical protein EEL30_26005 [Brevibacillus laterosporus]
MFKKLVGVSLIVAVSFGVTIPWTSTNVQGIDLPDSLSNGSITPDKIEYITSEKEKGQTIPVIYIDDPKALKNLWNRTDLQKNLLSKNKILAMTKEVKCNRWPGIRMNLWGFLLYLTNVTKENNNRSCEKYIKIKRTLSFFLELTLDILILFFIQFKELDLWII